jgi:hypothetical protein
VAYLSIGTLTMAGVKEEVRQDFVTLFGEGVELTVGNAALTSNRLDWTHIARCVLGATAYLDWLDAHTRCSIVAEVRRERLATSEATFTVKRIVDARITTDFQACLAIAFSRALDGAKVGGLSCLSGTRVAAQRTGPPTYGGDAA